MRYTSHAALRDALAWRLRDEARTSGIRLDQLRRRVMYARFVVGLDIVRGN